MSAVFLPPDYPRIRLVGSFEELVQTRFENGINALCWQRDLPGDYEEITRLLQVGIGITTLDDDWVKSLPLSDAGRMAADTMLADLERLRSRDLDPVLDCVHGFLRDEAPGPVPTDVQSFHADSATVEADTYLCTYVGACSEGLRNDQCIRRVDVPETRAALLADFGGPDDESFLEYLADNCFDLHYAALPGAVPFAFGVSNLWRIATLYPGSPVPPCIHRAPASEITEPKRLLLIS